MDRYGDWLTSSYFSYSILHNTLEITSQLEQLLSYIYLPFRSPMYNIHLTQFPTIHTMFLHLY